MFRVMHKSSRVPDVIINAADDTSLGEQAARHLIRHRILRPGIPIAAEIDTSAGRGTFSQRGVYTQNNVAAVTFEELS